MREMEKHPLLSKEEEHALAVRYYENEDLEAANKLVVSNLRFVVKIASEYRSYGFPDDGPCSGRFHRTHARR